MGVERQDAPDRPAVAVVAERLAGDGDRLGPVGRPRGHGEHQDLGPRAEEGAECRPGGPGRCRARGGRSRGRGPGGGSRRASGSRRSGGRGRTGCRRGGRAGARSRSRWTSPAPRRLVEERRGPSRATVRASGRPTSLPDRIEHRASPILRVAIGPSDARPSRRRRRTARANLARPRKPVNRNGYGDRPRRVSRRRRRRGRRRPGPARSATGRPARPARARRPARAGPGGANRRRKPTTRSG